MTDEIYLPSSPAIYNVYLTEQLSPDQFEVIEKVDNVDEAGVYITDIPDNPQDNLSILGDVPNDTFQTQSVAFPDVGTSEAHYLTGSVDGSSFTTTGGGFSSAGHEFVSFYSDAGLQPGQIITTQSDVPCFVVGTRIVTTRGEIAVETLAIGDLVITASGAPRPIRWLGHRTVDCRRHPSPRDAKPVRVLAHAFSDNQPARDLYLSPGHAICVDAMGEVLIPAAALVNGTTIVQVEVERVTYWHVELDTHDIVLAENLPAESYLDMGNRGFFAESRTVALVATPDAASATHADFCRPFHGDGPVVEAVRAWLEVRAAAIAAAAEDVRAA